MIDPIAAQSTAEIEHTPHLIAAALRNVDAFSALTDADLLWLAQHGIERRYDPGVLLFREGEPPSGMHIVLSGEIHIRRAKSANASFVINRTGQVVGLIPFSRLTGYGGTAHSIGDVWCLDIPHEIFAEMLTAVPGMTQACVTILLNRVRELTRIELQAEKLTALGKLAANLSHELNNPAAAARRTALGINTELKEHAKLQRALGFAGLSEEESQRYDDWMATAGSGSDYCQIPVNLGSALGQCDREDSVLQWLEAHDIPDAWRLAPTLAETTISTSRLDELAAFARPDLLPLMLANLACTARVDRSVETVVDATARIFELISSVQSYSHMDQAPIQEVDLAHALDTTLSMLTTRLQSVVVERDYASDLPAVSAFGSELNQVWMHLIDNALDAMGDSGTLRLTTSRSGAMAVVEVFDSGHGVAPELATRIFEPYFTTKPPGQGLGLGLDSVNRVIAKHSGMITLESQPGCTCFRVRLPISHAKTY